MKFLRRYEAWVNVDGEERMVGRYPLRRLADWSLTWRIGDPVVVALAVSHGIRITWEVRDTKR